MQGALSVGRAECRPAFLGIVADDIDDRRRLLHRAGNRWLVPYVGAYELDLAVPAEPFEEGCALGVSKS